MLRFLDGRALTQSCTAAAAAEPGGSGKGKSAKGSKGDSSGAAFPSHPALAVHRVRWSRNAMSRNAEADGINGGGGGSGADGRGGTVGADAKTLGWLAHGGAAGLVCIQRLP